jgi:hypothetical protein
MEPRDRTVESRPGGSATGDREIDPPDFWPSFRMIMIMLMLRWGSLSRSRRRRATAERHESYAQKLSPENFDLFLLTHYCLSDSFFRRRAQ